jgi:uncharacterized protein
MLMGGAARAAEVIPPKPAHHFNDYAHVVNDSVAQELDRKLADFEKQTSNQVVVAIYPKMQSDSSIEDYTVRVAHGWGIGQKGRDNGVVLFVFIQNRTMFIQVGYGLEGALPDALAKQIVEQEIKPRFRNNDYAGGLIAGINAIIAATKGEYKALPQRNSVNRKDDGSGWGFLIVVIVFVIFWIIARRAGSRTYGRRGVGWMPIFLPPMGGGSWGRSSGGGWGGGGGGGSWGGGGFSGGGGGFGGGGAGGSW